MFHTVDCIRGAIYPAYTPAPSVERFAVRLKTNQQFSYFRILRVSAALNLYLELNAGQENPLTESRFLRFFSLLRRGREITLPHICIYIIKLIKCKPQIELNVQKCPQDHWAKSVQVKWQVEADRYSSDICLSRGCSQSL